MSKIKHIVITIVIAVISGNLNAQQVYKAIQGTIAIIMDYNDTTLIAESRQLMATINYETGEVRFSVPYKSFRTGNNTMDTGFIKLNKLLEFRGVLNVPYIDTKNHPPVNFDVTGTILSSIPPVNVQTTGTLTHIPAGEISCMLTIKIQSSLSSLNILSEFNKTNDRIQIYIQQAILKREDE